MSSDMSQIKIDVAVLLATCNGLPWISQQVESIFGQIEVNIQLYVSDDFSTDGTWEWLHELSERNAHVILLPHMQRFSSAGKNFFRLIRDVDTSAFDYIAFSDQDDIWQPDKLTCHIQLAQQHSADGVSSNVTAFWPDGKQQLVNKSAPQRRYDFLFESAGPGCTFLMTTWLLEAVRRQLNDDASTASDVSLHDWLIYAICRAHGKKWHIDPTPSLRYRQHSSNVLGANTGWQAGWSRIAKMRDGWYRREILNIAKVCSNIANKAEYAKMIALLEPKSYLGNISLLCRIGQLRRNVKDRLFLAFALLAGLF